MRIPKTQPTSVLGTLVLLGLAFMACRETPASEWTTVSDKALTEFEEGLAAELKMYEQDARQHFEKALEEDPDFVMAQLKIFYRTSQRDPRFEELREHLAAADLDQLTPREAFLTQFVLKQRSRHYEEAWELLSDYLGDAPRDPYGLELKCQSVWETANWAEAESCYETLLAADPNWITAQNRLGYLAMAQGKFDQAEERFRNYRYVAPDQANPHDSLGELFVLIGRYEEAERELREALEIRPDFCASYQNLATSAIYQGKVEEAHAVADEAARNNCAHGLAERMRCQADTFGLYRQAKWEELAKTVDGECYRKGQVPPWMPHLGALHLGNLELAEHLEESVIDAPSGTLKAEKYRLESPDYLSLLGTRLLSEGDCEKAADKLAEADDLLDYWGLGSGMYKVYNRIIWTEALSRCDQEEPARELLAEVQSVNPEIAALYQSGNFDFP